MEAGEAGQGMLLPGAAVEHVEGVWGNVKGAGAAKGKKEDYPMVTSPFESSGLKRKVGGLYWVNHQTFPLHQGCCQWAVGHNVLIYPWHRE